jgi:hypothetical protein
MILVSFNIFLDCPDQFFPCYPVAFCRLFTQHNQATVNIDKGADGIKEAGPSLS